MKKIFRIFAPAAVMAVLVSCWKEDNTIAYGYETFGNTIDGKFISDSGEQFNFTEIKTAENPLDMERSYILCDVLEKTDEGFNARLNGVVAPLCKDVLMESGITDNPGIGNDPIYIASVWISGGYLNIIFMYESSGSSGTEHLVNAVYDDNAGQEDGLVFTIRHNACGETPAEGMTGLEYETGIATFPIYHLIPEENVKTKITIKWEWFVQSGESWGSDVTVYSADRYFTPGSYVHPFE